MADRQIAGLTARSLAITDVLGTQDAVAAAEAGKNTMQDVKTLLIPYKSYVALMSQTGTSAPTVKVLLNELSAAIVWTYGSAGNYVGTLTGAFTLDKTFLPPDIFQQYNAADFTNVIFSRLSANQILIVTTIGPNGAGVSSNGVIVNDYPIEIRVYL